MVKKEIVFLGDAHIVTRLQALHYPLVKNTRHLVPLPMCARRPHHLIEVDVHGTTVLTAAAYGADPGETRINEFLVQTEQGHAYGLAHVHAVHSGNRAAAGAGPAGKAQIRILTGQLPLLSLAEY
jgi:hypothetical protein